MTITLGHEVGAVCGRGSPCCAGKIQQRPKTDCSCHLRPPCGACTEHREYCDTCDWEAKNDRVINDYVANVTPDGLWKTMEPRPLDSSKIDFRTRSHTHSSQICEGVYPYGTSRGEVEERVKGTFGGRFTLFNNGKFSYVAYTD